jgi:hypothetical protein
VRLVFVFLKFKTFGNYIIDFAVDYIIVVQCKFSLVGKCMDIASVLAVLPQMLHLCWINSRGAGPGPGTARGQLATASGRLGHVM